MNSKDWTALGICIALLLWEPMIGAGFAIGYILSWLEGK